jgi:CelD/BcsL family acetyltransferase involved in cellulose biosynthesis
VSFRLEIVSEIWRLRELEPSWSERILQWRRATPFHLPDWVLTWWDHFGSGELQTLIAWQDGSIVGVVPCFRHVWQNRRQLTLVGSGVTDYLDPFLADECVESTVTAIGQYLAETDYDLCEWQDLSPTSPLLKLAQLDQLELLVAPDTICTEVKLEGDFNQYWLHRSSEMRRNVRRYTEKAEKIGPLRFNVDCNSNADTLNTLLTLHTARWRSRGESGMVEANHSGDFMCAVGAKLARRGVLRLFTLSWCERVVAVIFAFSWNGRMYGYFSAFDPEDAQLGFGRILLSRCIQYAYETGHSHWNFLRGDEPYKASWGAECVPKCRLTIRRRVDPYTA